MADELNPAEKTAADADYEGKFNHTKKDGDDEKGGKALEEKEKSPDVAWKASSEAKKSDSKRGLFRYAGRHAGTVRKGSAFSFVVIMIVGGVWYSSIFAPNIILVNIKEMFTNDLADSTVALNSYYWKMMNYKIGRPQCGGGSGQQDIKCKLSLMSVAQVKAFQKYGFTVIGNQVYIGPPQGSSGGSSNTGQQSCQNNQITGSANLGQQYCRYQVTAIIPPSNATPAPIVTGDMLYAWSKMNNANKSLTYGVFDPKSSFFMDSLFKQRLKNMFGLTKSTTVSGENEQQVNQSFDASMNGGGSINIAGRPDPNGGLDLASLSNPARILELEAAIQPLALESTSWVGLQCAWYSLGKAVMNDGKYAKAATLARFADIYLKAADQIKAGTSEEMTINTLSGKLAQSTFGNGYSGANATDSSLYKAIVYGQPPIPSVYGLLYYLDTFDLIGAMTPAWSQIMASAASEGAASNVPGSLLMPPANLLGTDRQYCLGGETFANHDAYKVPENDCQAQIAASAPPGWQGALAPVDALSRQTCPPPHYDQTDRTWEGIYHIQPPLKATASLLSPYVAGIFGANIVAWANVLNLLYGSGTKGVAASDALFAGTGEILGDMAQSRGMEPANAATLGIYLAQKPAVEKDFDELARYNASKHPFDPYNKFSFLGSILRGLTLKTDSHAPLFGVLANSLSLVGDGLKHLNPNANAIYYLQPDGFNPLRMSCPDPEYIAIGITADTACNVRYSMGPQELLAQPDSVIQYMEQAHPDLTQNNITELQQRLAQADPEMDVANISRMLTIAQTAAQQPEIDKATGKPIEDSEYQKYLDYCVNRQDPWGRSAVAVKYSTLSADQEIKRLSDKDQNLSAISAQDSGNPYQKTPQIPYPSITEGASADQDWYTGKKCLEQSEELMNFRAYTMMCSVDGSLSGGVDCTDVDNPASAAYSDQFYNTNDILYLSYY